ncbi:hypothetical protein ACFT2C_03140 [Promicromonospora sp. NPDC057138]|uniref:hypothetical protein n=1 Tax=Promicromonospora sp. NPDC057138 TaxID=3346031 RepID=UPI0036275A51
MTTRAGTIRFAIAPVPSEVGDDFEVQVFVDDVEMTSRGAGLGMSPFSLLIPENRLVATTEPRVVPIARCTCGVYGCGVTDVRIQRDGGVVHWEWLHETPVDHGTTFDAAPYDAEVARIGADHAWERPQDTAQRLILTGVDRARLADDGLTLRFAEPVFDDPSTYRVVLRTIDNAHQVFLRFPLRGRGPLEVVDEVVETLRTPPATWPATFSPMSRAVQGAPGIAGRRWRQERSIRRRRTKD